MKIFGVMFIGMGWAFLVISLLAYGVVMTMDGPRWRDRVPFRVAMLVPVAGVSWVAYRAAQWVLG